MKKSTLKNSASNSFNIQVLQAQTQQLLSVITQALSALQYDDIAHQRISRQNSAQTNEANTHSIENNSYQGLTRAKHPQFGSVMIKWQLKAHDSHFSSDLNYEVDILRYLNNSSQNPSDPTTIVPSLFDYHNVDVQALGKSQQLTVLVMPYYENGSLAKQLNRQQHLLLKNEQKYGFINQTAHLIANLHNAGWLHNDIKPSNILLDDQSVNSAKNSNKMPDLLIIDFALTERFDRPKKANIAGTPAYLAPERWHGQGATLQSDIYAFGIMMVEILIGERPFKINRQSSNPMLDWAIQHCQTAIPTLPIEYSHYQSIVDGALAKGVEKRYESMEEVLEVLKSL